MGRLREHNVVATFPDMDTARTAMKELGQAGVDANNISLLGRQAEESAVTRDTRERDFQATDDIAKRTVSGAAVGSAVGGAVAGAAAFLVPGVGPVVGTGIWLAVGGGAMAGGTVGGMVGGISGLPLNEDWELTYENSVKEGRVLVAIHTNDAQEADRGAEVFDRSGAGEVERLNSQGRPVGQPAEQSTEQNPSS